MHTLVFYYFTSIFLAEYQTNEMQSYWEITSDPYLDYIKSYVVGIGPWKDTVVPVINNYLQEPTDLVARAHAHNLQVHFLSGPCISNIRNVGYIHCHDSILFEKVYC